jgi:hypothetical protein
MVYQIQLVNVIEWKSEWLIILYLHWIIFFIYIMEKTSYIVEQELLIRPEHMSLHPVFSGLVLLDL